MKPKLSLAGLVGVSLVLSGCASLGIDTQRESVAAFAKAQSYGDTPVLTSAEERTRAEAEVNSQLSMTLTQEAAVRIAISSNPAFQAMRAALEASSAQSGARAQPPNPLFTFERLVRKDGGGVDLDFGRMLTTSLFAWLSLPSRLKVAQHEQASQQLQAVTQLTETVANVRHAWVRAVAAEQAAVYFGQVKMAAQASAELARRMQSVGNFSKLQRAREQAFYADATLQQARALHAARAAREFLVRAIGLTAEQASRLKLPDRLPDLPAAQKTAPEVTTAALAQRLDIRMAHATLSALAGSRSLVGGQRLFGDTHIAGIRNSETGKTAQRGYEIELPIPIFDWGTGLREELTARIRAAEQRAEYTSRAAASQLRESYSAYVTAYEIAKHYRDEIVPLRKSIADEMLLKYNGMLIGVFELLADSREQVGSVIQAIEAQRDFWLADAGLQSTLLGAPSMPLMLEPTRASGADESKGH